MEKFNYNNIKNDWKCKKNEHLSKYLQKWSYGIFAHCIFRVKLISGLRKKSKNMFIWASKNLFNLVNIDKKF